MTHLDTMESPRRRKLTRIVRLCVGMTISYNLIEAIVAISAGAIASSTALIGFGIDSLVEVSSAAAVAWQFSASTPERREARERTALRLITFAFVALAAYLVIDSTRVLWSGNEPDHSTVGIVLAALSLVIMPVLALTQRRAGQRLGSASAVADSRQTLLCSYLSAIVLVGLLANSVLGWWWADPLAALAIAGLALKEARETWKGDGCCATPSPLSQVEDHDEQQEEPCSCC
ncbi:cation transporter [Haloglycomyces albus]|uniref:cation transporter n=1 Tax=Haloglycomyces albus TaxID=526067 RepID=UPI00046D0CD7|nr:cation transporter [Haloglycomyces albus]